VHVPAIEDFVDRLAKHLGGREAALATEVINRNASAHFVGGIPIAESAEGGAVDPYLRMFGQPGLHVMDGSVMPANPGVNPSAAPPVRPSGRTGRAPTRCQEGRCHPRISVLNRRNERTRR
jgi:hypothetical protein